MVTIDVNDFEVEKECYYQGEKYIVRDNGAVLRYPKDDTKPRLLDNKWTFGKVGNHGYLYLASKGIHRIVATAFHGENLSKEYIVDHIDTNKQNNRPENLRWITKEENIMNNPNTRDKIQYITGCSIEELKGNNWEELHKYTSEKQNTSWMRPTTKEEAENFHKKQEQWLSKKSEMNEENQKLYEQLMKISNIQEKNQKEKIGMGEWVFEPSKERNIDIFKYYFPSINMNAVQTYKTPTEFQCCPDVTTEKSLDIYYINLDKNKLFSQNQYYKSYIIKADFDKKKEFILVQCLSLNNKKDESYSLFKIKLEHNYYVHCYKKQFNSKDDCDVIYDYLLNKIPFDEHNLILWEYEYM